MEIRTESLTLRTADGKMPVHLAAPVAAGPYAAVIVIMEAFGLNGHIKAVAERIAREGYVTVGDRAVRKRANGPVKLVLPGIERGGAGKQHVGC